MKRRESHLNREALFKDLGYRPHEGQWSVHRSTASRRIVACGVRWGKSRLAAMEAIAAALEPAERSVGWTVAPTYDLCDRIFREIQVILLEKLRHRVVSMREHDRKIVLRNLGGGTSEIRGKTADNPVSLLGEGLDWVVVDEASRLRPDVWEAYLTQRLLDKNGWALLISTPKGKGYFHDLYRRGQGRDEAYESWNHPSWTSPYLDKTVIDAERARLPERVFQQEYGAQFIEGSGSVFRNVRECATGKFREREPHRPGVNDNELRFLAGLDLAKVEDFTVFTILDHSGNVRFIDRFNRIDWATQIRRIVGTSERFCTPYTACDVTGVGDPIFETLRGNGCNLSPYPFTQKSKNALIDNLAMMLERKELTLPTPQEFPELVDELEAYQYDLGDRGGVKSGAPRGMHDDCVMSLALAAWLGRPTRPMPGFIFLKDRTSPFTRHWTYDW